MTRRRFLFRLAVICSSVIAVIAGGVLLPGLLAQQVCPKCGAPLEPGAAFCVKCGQKVEGAPAPAADSADWHRAVVQVITVHDNELTSTFASLAYGSTLKIDSILGSAFAVAPGEFVTDSGLLVGAREVTLRTQAGRSVTAQVLGSDQMIGIALLKADLPGVGALSLRADEPPHAGESLTALGFATGARAGGEPIVSAGVVSGLHRGASGIHPIEDYFQTDASLPHGLAGGPMVDARGRVVGMSTGLVLGSRVLLGPQSGIGYAVPAEWVARGLDWIRSGSVPRAWLGAFAVPADAERRARYKLSPDVKLIVEQVFPGSPAAAAGLVRGDGLVKVLNEEAVSLPRLHERLLKTRPGESAEVAVSRAGQPLSFNLTLTPRPEKPRLSGIDSLRFFGELEIVRQDDDTLVVGSVIPGSEPSRAKIASGDVLLSVLSKKDWEHGAKDNSRWRSVHTVTELESRLDTAYSEFDFCLGLRFRAKDGTKRELLLWEILTPTAAL